MRHGVRAPGGALNHPDTCVMHYLYSYSSERMSGAEIIGLAARASHARRWSILTFHGVNEGIFQDPPSICASCANTSAVQPRALDGARH